MTLKTRAFAGLLILLVLLAASLFIPAWTLDYWQAWILLAVFFVSVLPINAYLLKHDPKLLERRLKAGPVAEKQKRQKVIQFLAQIAFIAILAFSALDHRFAWSTVSPLGVAAGDILIALGFLIIFFVLKENTFASSIIEVTAEQTLVSTGPYALVRHPMYAGALVMLLGVPPALGSWWGMFMIIPIALVIVWRLLEEEKFLAKSLPGYAEYQDKVKYRLLPFIW